MTKSSVYWLYLISWPKLTYQLICWLHVCKNNKYKVIIAGAKVQLFISLLFLHVLFFSCFCIFLSICIFAFFAFLWINSWPLGSGFVHFRRFTLSCIFCTNSWRRRVFWYFLYTFLHFYTFLYLLAFVFLLNFFFVRIAGAGEFLFLYFCMLCKRNS